MDDGYGTKLKPGDSCTLTVVITEKDVRDYASLVGDTNPIHLKEAAAKERGFRKCIAHGMLAGAFISTVLGTKFPGEGTVYLEQNLKFRKPVYVGEECRVSVAVAEVLNSEKGIYRLSTRVADSRNGTVIDGYAVIKYVR